MRNIRKNGFATQLERENAKNWLKCTLRTNVEKKI